MNIHITRGNCSAARYLPANWPPVGSVNWPLTPMTADLRPVLHVEHSLQSTGSVSPVGRGSVFTRRRHVHDLVVLASAAPAGLRGSRGQCRSWRGASFLSCWVGERRGDDADVRSASREPGAPFDVWNGQQSHVRHATSQELVRLRALNGRGFDVLFPRSVTRRHEDGSALSRHAADRAAVPIVRRLANAIASSQEAQVRTLESMLTARNAQPLGAG